jgi:hypothetical protein
MSCLTLDGAVLIVYIKVVNALRLVVSLHSATDVQGESCVEQLAFLEYAAAYASSSATYLRPPTHTHFKSAWLQIASYGRDQ